MRKIYKIKSVEETWDAAADVAKLLVPGSVMALHGDLGAGKTTFMQGIAMALNIDRPVTSPTFTLSNEYDASGFKLVHMDLYRLSGPDDLLDIGYCEHLENGAAVALEWPERAGEMLPRDTIHVFFEIGESPEERIVSIVKNED
ncbi:MAG: tRNA (adenosine(37)-N6)-threonylcarbamoyltransferase complex ATPase subunit type 1 TsaE [Kiritimatiellia bacterium]